MLHRLNNLTVSYLFLAGHARSASASGVPRLHLEHSAEEIFGGGGEELYLGVGVQPVQVGALRRQTLVYVCVVTLVVRVRRDWESRS